MKYMGSKNRIAKHILPIMLKEMQDKGYTTWVEPFVGGGNMIDKVPSEYKRIGFDLNKYLIALLSKAINDEFDFKEHITKEQRDCVLSNKDEYEDWFVGYVGFICGFGGDFNGGYAGYYPETRRAKSGKLPSYQEESRNSLLKQSQKLRGVYLQTKDYREIGCITDSLIYCDPPYNGTTGYNDCKFNHKEFFEWCRDIKSKGNTVFVSEYNAPADFEIVWEGVLSSQMSANGKSGGTKMSVEKLFKV